MNYEELDRILPEQRLSLETIEKIKHMSKDFKEHGLCWVMMSAYSLGMIEGKRAERSKRK